MNEKTEKKERMQKFETVLGEKNKTLKYYYLALAVALFLLFSVAALIAFSLQSVTFN